MDNTKRPKKQHHLIEYANGKSLEEINGTVKVPKGKGFFRTLFAYSGPGALVAVGYMDPGNWSTSITGGQSFQYTLMTAILVSSLIAMLLQYMAAKLGIVSQMDLAQATRARTGKALGIVLWIMTELAIMATDIAEVIGAAIALNLLFHIPLVPAVFITVLDVLVLLLLTKIGFRKIEAIVACLILVILVVFAYEVALSRPDWGAVLKGYIPTPKVIAQGPVVGGISPLSGTLGIVGATVMPHNLYLHSAISQTREIDHNDPENVRQTVRFTTWDSNIQLSLAFVVNSLLLIVGVAVFKMGAVKDTSFFGLYEALNNTSMLSNGILIAVAKSGLLATLFAVALLASGQNSTITGTLTGQVIMEGFVHMKMPLWARRLVTRVISIIPVLICVAMTGRESAIQQHQALNMLMENSQIFLAIDLPFSMLPLIMMTDSEVEMGEFKNNKAVKFFGWVSILLLTFLNLYNMPATVEGFNLWNKGTSDVVAWLIIIAIVALLLWTVIEFRRGEKHFREAHIGHNSGASTGEIQDHEED
ncbi:Nramp family divalent metal transporter [Limosilactobacillus difficilis]|uniref:Nramp family divalent metal transporter n=1 Tax=Limosilactobacillus difficilis TaxID=2991838 RepID=UPI0024BBB3BE|nr:Nramp family divalent metal transporter [Limosilactobacillus difficilis]